MKKMTKFFALALLAGAMVSCSTEDTAPSTQNDKVAVQFTGGISVNTRAAGVADRKPHYRYFPRCQWKICIMRFLVRMRRVSLRHRVSVPKVRRE